MPRPWASPQRRRGRPAATVAKPTDKARPVRTTVECPSSARTATDGPGRCARSYGAEGWGFESLRAGPPSAPRSTASEPGCELILYGVCLALTFGSRDTPGEACRASGRSAIMTVWVIQRLPFGRRTPSSADCWKSISGRASLPSSPADAARSVAARPHLMAAGIGPDVRSQLSWRSLRRCRTTFRSRGDQAEGRGKVGTRPGCHAVPP